DPHREMERPDGGLFRREPCAHDRPQARPSEGSVFHASGRVDGCCLADGWRVPCHRAGGDAGRNRLPPDGPVPATDHRQRGDRYHYELRRGLCELFHRWRYRRHHRRPANADLPCRVRVRAQAWRAGGPQTGAKGAGGGSMIETLLLPFQFPFMQQAFTIALLVALPMGALSPFLVLKGWSLMGDAISHAVLPGVVLAYLIGLPLAAGAFGAGMVCALAVGYLKQNSRVKEDTVMGVVFSGMFGLGIVMFSMIESDLHLLHILFGDMLGVTWGDVIETGVIALVTLGFGGLLRRDLLLAAFDPQHARAIGLPVRVYHYGL